LKSCCVLQDHYDNERDKTVFHNTTPDLQDQDRFFWSQTGLVLRPTVSDHITGHTWLRVCDTTFKVKRSKDNLQGRGNIVAASRTAIVSEAVRERLILVDHYKSQVADRCRFRWLWVHGLERGGGRETQFSP